MADLPHNDDSEAIVIGSLLVNPELIEDVRGILPAPSMFFRDENNGAYAAILSLADNGVQPDFANVSEEMARLGVCGSLGDRDGASDYLLNSCEQLPANPDARNHAKIVRELALKRGLARFTHEAYSATYQPDKTASDIVGILSPNLDKLMDDCVTGNIVTMQDISASTIELIRQGGVPGIKSGFSKIDGMTGGWKPGQLVIVGARPSVGKSAFMTELARRMEKAGVIFFTLEMGHREVWCRLVSMQSGLDSKMYETWKLSQAQQIVAERAERDVSRMNIMIDDSAGLTISDIVTRVRRESRKRQIGVVMVDYIGLVGASPGVRERHLQVGDITKRLKQLARELNVVVIAASQLNRNNMRENRRPGLSDLRESGSIEQDADHVFLLHRPEDTDFGDTCGIEVNAAKVRDGRTGRIQFTYTKHCLRFAEDSIEDFMGVTDGWGA